MEGCELAGSGSTGECSDRAVSAIAAVAMVCGSLALLVMADRAGGVALGTEAASLQVVWIERDEVPDEEDKVSVGPDPAEFQIKDGAIRRGTEVSDAQSDVLSSAIEEPTVQGRLDLSLPTAALKLRQGPFERAETIQKEPVLQVSFQDRSFGGRLQSRARGAVCAELRKALVSNPESYEAISSAMGRHACRL